MVARRIIAIVLVSLCLGACDYDYGFSFGDGEEGAAEQSSN